MDLKKENKKEKIGLTTLRKHKRLILCIIIILIIICLGLFVFRIPLNLKSLWSVTYCVVLMSVPVGYLIFYDTANPDKKQYAIQDIKNDNLSKPLWFFVIILLLVFLFIMVCSISSLGKSKKVIDIETAETYSDSFPIYENDKNLYISSLEAYQIGESLLVDYPNHSYTQGQYTKQLIDGELFLVAPVLNKNKKSYKEKPHSGYIKINANTKEGILVTENNNIDVRVNIQPSGFATGDKRLKELLYNHSKTKLYYYNNRNSRDFVFELDEDGIGYWVVPYYRNAFIFNLPEIKGISIVNANTGEIIDYKLEDIPSWVENVYPSSLIYKEVENWSGAGLDYGIFSPIVRTISDKSFPTTSNENNNFIPIRTREADNIIVTDEGICLIIGVCQDNSKKNSINGIAVADLKTKKTLFYPIDGKPEYKAHATVLSDTRINKETAIAEIPTIVIFNNIPTYLFTITNTDANMTEFYVLCSIEYPNTYGIGGTLKEAEIEYSRHVRSNKLLRISSGEEQSEIIGTVEKIAEISLDGTTHYRMIIDTLPDKSLLIPIEFVEAPFTSVGDEVSITLFITDEQLLEVDCFDNLEMEIE